jgi:hypothetical protein
VLSRQVLGDDVGVAEALRILGEARSLVDVLVYLWEPSDEDWRPATLTERRTLWDARGSEPAAA